MNIIIINIVVVVAVVANAYGAESPVMQCPGLNFEGLKDRIKVTPCGTKRCNLVKNTDTIVEFRFKPSHNVTDLVNEVSAELRSLPLDLPFIGVTGYSACSQVLRADTLKPSPCPLQAGQEYIYKNVFPIHSIYPETDLKVHWSLLDGKKSVICFQVPARIVHAKPAKTTKN